jgi:heterodisulfide reductase subunit B
MTNRYAFFRGCFIPVRLPHLEYVARKILPQVDVQLIDVNGFTCCPEPVGFGIHDKLTWVSIAARNICLAEELGLDILTLCNGCSYTLKNANKMLREDQELREKVNEVIADTGHQFKGSVKVKHFMEAFKEDVGERKLKEAVRAPLSGLRVATHTGCHIVSPSSVMEFDSLYNPTVLDGMVALLGASPVDYDLKLLCCGWTLMSYGPPEASYNLLGDKFKSMKAGEADCASVICPQCFYQFDMGQVLASRRMKLGFSMPVLFYLQLLGLAMGYSLEEMWYGMHRVKDKNLEEKIGGR